MHRTPLLHCAETTFRALNTRPGTLADDLCCTFALCALGAIAYVFLVLQ